MRWVSEDKERLDHFLCAHMEGVTRSKVGRLIDAGGVAVNGETATKSGLMLRIGDSIEAEPPVETPPHAIEPADIPLDVIFEDEHLLVVNKPRGMSAHPSPKDHDPTLVHALLFRGHSLSENAGPYRPGIVHRLDKETTGLMIVAKSDAAHAALSDQIKKRQVERRYVAVVRKEPDLNRFTIDAPIGRDPRRPVLRAIRADGKPAVTHVKVLHRVNRGALLACKLETGRTHQIRVHLSHFGYEVWGDKLYTHAPYSAGALQLHAAFLKFQHPASGAVIACFAKPPTDFLEADLVIEAEVVDWI